MELNKDIAQRILSEVDERKRFFSVNGEVYKNLSDLSLAIKNMSKDTFSYHVNEEKNDFASWIYDVIGDFDLAKELRKSKTKKEFASLVSKRISKLKSLSK